MKAINNVTGQQNLLALVSVLTEQRVKFTVTPGLVSEWFVECEIESQGILDAFVKLALSKMDSGQPVLASDLKISAGLASYIRRAHVETPPNVVSIGEGVLLLEEMALNARQKWFAEGDDLTTQCLGEI